MAGGQGIDLLFLLHCLTSGNCSTLQHKATKIYATCDLSKTYSPAHSRGVLGNSLSVDIRGSSAQLSPAQRLALQSPTRFACSGSGLCLFSSAGMPCSAWAPALCAVIGKLSPGRKWGQSWGSSCELCRSSGIAVLHSLSLAVQNSCLMYFVEFHSCLLERSSSVPIIHHGWAFSAKPIFFFSRLFSVWTGISLGDTGGQNEE